MATVADGTQYRVQVVAISGASRFAIEQVVRTASAPSDRCYVVVYLGGGDIVPSLRLASSLPVKLLDDGAPPEADTILVVPPGGAAALVKGRFQLVPAQGEGAAPVDRLFRSLASELGADTTAVVLSGPGTDGTIGAKRIKECDGIVIAQAPTDAEQPQLPMATIATGLVDLILPASEIGARLGTLVPLDEAVAVAVANEPRRDNNVDTLRDVLTLVRIRTGHDFSQYKQPTLLRRIARRMQVCQTATLGEYHRYLREHVGELAHLLRDFLISVTNFFRDAESFDALARTVIPKLFSHKSAGEQLRVWVAGCATGEEAYSLGILLLEHAGRISNAPSIQIFATDIDEEALVEARAGRYHASIAADLSAERLARFFVRESDQYRVTKELRELVLFSPHNLLRDPPFSRLDLVSCRNVLIYLNREAQDRVLSMFHFGLRNEGVLFLGSSESAEAASLQFGVLDAKARLFGRRAAPVEVVLPASLVGTRWAQPTPALPLPERTTLSAGDLHHRIVEYYGAPSVIVSSDLELLHVSERAGRYLQFAGGEPTRQLLRVITPGLRLELRSAIYSAQQGTREPVRRRVEYLDEDGTPRAVELRVQPVTMPELGSGLLLIAFEEAAGAAPRAFSGTTSGTAIEPVVRELEDDLQKTRDQLRTSIEQYETSVEELKASNEELQAINEELRSATEELETSKEELQSVNEELTTLNHELKQKVDELSRANSDLQNLMSSTDLAVLFLDRSLQIKRFTRRALGLFNLISSDVGRPLAHVTHGLLIDDLAGLAREVMGHLRVVERELASRDGGRYLLRVLPYRSLEDRIDGVVMTFIDIGELRRTEAELAVSNDRFRIALDAAPAVALTHGPDGACTWAYLLGQELPIASNIQPWLGADQLARLDELRAQAAAERQPQRIELTLALEHGPRVFETHVARMPGTASQPIAGWTSIGFDITPRKQAEATLREADRRKDEFLATLSHELRNPLTPLRVALDVQKLAPDDPSTTQRTRVIMDRQVDHLIALVDELLDMSRIAQGKIDLERGPVDVRELVAAAVEDTRSLATSMQHRVVVTSSDEPVIVTGDRTRLVQVFVNLVTNACKYTPAGGAIYVTVRREVERGRAVVAVRDTGLGLAPDELSEIFELFAQSRDSRGRSRGGLGIGLNLVRRLIELHGGTVAATSPGVGAGSTFTVELPLRG